MTTRNLLISMLLLCSLALAACGGGGGGAPKVTAIVINPANPAAGSLAQLTGTLTGAPAGTSRTWTVTGGSLSVEPPDFALLLRGAAKASSALTLTTTEATVYWLAPADAGSYTVTLAVGTDSKSSTVTLGDSPISLSVADGEDGAKVVTVNADGVSDLYQAAFRVTHTSAWRAASVEPGTFLGDATNDILFMGLTNQSGFVPVAITRRGSAPGVDGSGTLATITFEPTGGAASRAGSAVPFDLSLVVLRDSDDAPIEF